MIARVAPTNTLVVFTSDHGSQVGAQGVAPWNKKQPYQASIHVPWIMRLPGVLEGASAATRSLARSTSSPPSVALLGVPIPRTVEGYDLSGAWRGRAGAIEQDAVLTMNFSSRYDWIGNGAEWRGVRTKRYNYAAWLDGREVHLRSGARSAARCTTWHDAPEARSDASPWTRRMADLQAQRGDVLVPCESYRDWFDTQRRVVRNA